MFKKRANENRNRICISSSQFDSPYEFLYDCHALKLIFVFLNEQEDCPFYWLIKRRIIKRHLNSIPKVKLKLKSSNFYFWITGCQSVLFSSFNSPIIISGKRINIRKHIPVGSHYVCFCTRREREKKRTKYIAATAKQMAKNSFSTTFAHAYGDGLAFSYS